MELIGARLNISKEGGVDDRFEFVSGEKLLGDRKMDVIFALCFVSKTGEWETSAVDGRVHVAHEARLTPRVAAREAHGLRNLPKADRTSGITARAGLSLALPDLLHHQPRDLLRTLISANNELFVSDIKPHVLVSKFPLKAREVLAHDDADEMIGDGVAVFPLSLQKSCACDNFGTDLSPLVLWTK